MNTIAIEIFGATALLLWGLRMVRTGVSRAFGVDLRRGLAFGTRNRVTAFFAGLCVTLALQSSTPTSLMAVSFASRGLITSMMAIAIMLGADVGTSLVAQAMSVDIRLLSPIFISGGVILFSVNGHGKLHALGRAIVGLGLMLLALNLLVQSTEPIRQADSFGSVLAALNQAPMFALIGSAVLTMLTASSLAIIILIASFAAGGQVDPKLALILVLGANIGATILPLLASHGTSPIARRAALGRMLIRTTGALVVLPFCGAIGLLLSKWTGTNRLVVDAHVAFNCLVALVSIPFIGLVARALERLLPLDKDDDQGPVYLDPAYLDSPSLALTSAARETLRLGDRIDVMLRTTIRALTENDAKLCDAVAKMDDEIDRIHESIKLYLSQLAGLEELGEDNNSRVNEILSFAVNLEHAGDIIDNSLRVLVAKKIRNHLSFSDDGNREIESLFTSTLQNLQMAQGILFSRDRELAKRLIGAKVDIRRTERNSAERHFDRLRRRNIHAVQTSSLHLDILRDLKRINAHIASVAYPILEQQGVLGETRLTGGTGHSSGT